MLICANIYSISTAESTPLLVIGTQRSGSNLLRLILNQHPQIDAPHPPHLLQIFYPLLPLYGNLQQPPNFKQLAQDIADYVNVNPVPWDGLTLTAEAILQRCAVPALPEVFKVVYQLKAELKSARYWCCKSMANVYYIPEIEAAGMQPYYIHLLRDGRDVAASFKNAIVGDKHVYFIARQWVKEQELARSMTQHYAPNRITVIRYEEFTANPKAALIPTLSMLGLNWNDDLLNFYLSDEAKRTAASGEMWKNVIKPVDNTNARHYSEKMNAEEIRIFEAVAGNTLVEFGYKTDNNLAQLSTDFTAEEIASFKAVNEKLKAEAKLKYTLDAAVRIPQQQVLEQIKKRGVA